MICLPTVFFFWSFTNIEEAYVVKYSSFSLGEQYNYNLLKIDRIKINMWIDGLQHILCTCIIHFSSSQWASVISIRLLAIALADPTKSDFVILSPICIIVVFALYLIANLIIFRKLFQLNLPDHWLQIVLHSPKLFSVRDIQHHYQIISVITETIESNPQIPISSEVDVEGPNFIGMKKIRLPWSEKFWDLVVTNPKSTVEIWGRLIGAEYSVSTRKNSSNIQNNDNKFYFCFRINLN